VALCAGCTGDETRSGNVLVICVDVLRSDHVGAYGYPRATSPSMDTLARSGVVFESAFSAASWTKPSVPSYFTGRFPHQHGVYHGSRELDGKLVTDVLQSEEQTLAELFKAQGFRTVAIQANPTVGAEFGFSQGFDEFLEEDVSGEDVRKRFESWLGRLDPDTPFFAYVHFNDVHLPYDPPGSHRTAFGDGVSEVDFSTGAWKLLKRRVRDGKVQVSDADRQTMIDLYDGEIQYADTQIDEALSALDDLGVLDETLVVVLSDHGEELLDRGGIGHGSTLYNELLSVPLIFRFPGDEHAGLRIAEPVSLVDLLPTLMDYFGLEIPAGATGRSLLPLISGQPMDPRPVYSEGIHSSSYQQALRVGDWKYIVSVPVEKGGYSGLSRVEPDLTEGLRVEVEGMPASDGGLVAGKLEIKEDQKDDLDEVTGPIEKIEEGGSVLSILGFRVRLSSRARTENHMGEGIDRDVLRVGNLVKVYGRALTAEDFEARRLKMRDPARKKKHKLEGRIAGAVRKVGRERVFLLAGREVRLDRKAEIEHQGMEEETAMVHTTDPWLDAMNKMLPLNEELYDLGNDPGEREDLSKNHPERIREMRSALAAVRATSGTGTAPTRELTEEELEQLRALGYVD